MAQNILFIFVINVQKYIIQTNIVPEVRYNEMVKRIES